MKGILILLGIGKVIKLMTEVTYIGLGRDTHEFNTRVRFRLRFILTGSWSCHCTKPWPKVQEADNVEPSNEYALVFW